MPGRPSKRVIALELVALVAAVGVAVWPTATRTGTWPLFAVLLASSVVGDLTALDAPTSRMKISSSFLTIVTATVLLGETPAAVIGVVTILAAGCGSATRRQDLLINLVAYAWFPLLSGIAFTPPCARPGRPRRRPLLPPGVRPLRGRAG